MRGAAVGSVPVLGGSSNYASSTADFRLPSAPVACPKHRSSTARRRQHIIATAEHNGHGKAAAAAAPPKPQYTNANMPLDPDGRTYHLNTRVRWH